MREVNKKLYKILKMSLLSLMMLLAVEQVYANVRSPQVSEKFFSCTKVLRLKNKNLLLVSSPLNGNLEKAKLLLVRKVKLELKNLTNDDYKTVCVSDSSVKMATIRNKNTIQLALKSGFIIERLQNDKLFN